MISTTSSGSSFGQTLQFITDIKLQELGKQRVTKYEQKLSMKPVLWAKAVT